MKVNSRLDFAAMKISPKIFSWALLPVMAVWCASAFVFAFHQDDFDRSTFWSSSFFALEWLILCLSAFRIHMAFKEKARLAPWERVALGMAVVCTLCMVGLLSQTAFKSLH